MKAMKAPTLAGRQQQPRAAPAALLRSPTSIHAATSPTSPSPSSFPSASIPHSSWGLLSHPSRTHRGRGLTSSLVVTAAAAAAPAQQPSGSGALGFLLHAARVTLFAGVMAMTVIIGRPGVQQLMQVAPRTWDEARTVTPAAAVTAATAQIQAVRQQLQEKPLLAKVLIMTVAILMLVNATVSFVEDYTSGSAPGSAEAAKSRDGASASASASAGGQPSDRPGPTAGASPPPSPSPPRPQLPQTPTSVAASAPPPPPPAAASAPATTTQAPAPAQTPAPAPAPVVTASHAPAAASRAATSPSLAPPPVTPSATAAAVLDHSMLGAPASSHVPSKAPTPELAHAGLGSPPAPTKSSAGDPVKLAAALAWAIADTVNNNNHGHKKTKGQ